MSSSLRKVKSGKPTSIKKILQDDKKRIRFYLLAGGFFLVVVGFLLSKPPSNWKSSKNTTTVQETEKSTTFAQEPVKIDSSLLREDLTKKIVKTPPTRLLIPDINMDVSVKEAKVINGYWEVFSDSAGFGLGSAYPQDIGNQVIFAHAKAGLFLPLKEVKVGQKVYVFTKDSWYTYQVQQIKEVLPSQVEVIAPTKDAVLTLYTCSGFADSKRLIVTAKKV